jgi:hypothetical protein
VILSDRSVVLVFEDHTGDKFHPSWLPWTPPANSGSFGNISIEFLTIFYLRVTVSVWFRMRFPKNEKKRYPDLAVSTDKAQLSQRR